MAMTAAGTFAEDFEGTVSIDAASAYVFRGSTFNDGLVLHMATLCAGCLSPKQQRRQSYRAALNAIDKNSGNARKNLAGLLLLLVIAFADQLIENIAGTLQITLIDVGQCHVQAGYALRVACQMIQTAQ